MANDTSQTPKTSPNGDERPKRGENHEDYARVVARLNERWRVIVSSDRPPCRRWILQKSVLLHGQPEWHGKSFCQSRQALVSAIREKVTDAHRFYKGTTSMPIDFEALALVESLPERISQDADDG